MRVILIGFAASYKTSVGKILAQQLHAEFWDTDLQVESAWKMSVADLFRTQGERAFRNAESDVLAGLQGCCGVISCGGGAVLSPNFRNFAQGGVVVWLQASAQTVLDRLEAGKRPLFDGMSVEQLQQQMELRKPLYEKYATFSVVTDGKTSAQVASEVEHRLVFIDW